MPDLRVESAFGELMESPHRPASFDYWTELAKNKVCPAIDKKADLEPQERLSQFLGGLSNRSPSQITTQALVGSTKINYV